MIAFRRHRFSSSSRIAVIALCGLISGPLAAQNAPPLTQKLGVAPDITLGTLPNGIRYYIKKNVEPAKRAELRLVVNAGSVLEDDDQRGYAHFVEHTAFNGTRHFKKNDLVKYLQSIGVRFGADLNASTNFDETIYQLSVPTDTARLVETAFLILEDWAHGQLFDSAEVVNERGVVLEEWRGRLGAGDRMLQEALPVILKDSRYAVRLPIGTEQSIQKATPSLLRRFYRDWYRPDLMAVVAVGDFDVKTIEGLIKKHFSGVARVSNPRPRTEPSVPNNVAPLVVITTDPEAGGSSVSIDIKHPSADVTTIGDYRRDLVENLYFEMINDRLIELSQSADPPFISASVSSGSYIGRSVSSLSFYASVKDGGIERGAEAVLIEARRADQFGFLEAELRRAKDNMLRAYERMYAERAKTHSAALVGELVRNFLVREHIPGIEAEYEMTRRLLPGVTLAEVNTLARAWITDENRVIWASAPAKPGVTVPTQAQLLAVIDRASKATVTAYAEKLADDPLIPSLAAPGRVVATRTVDAVGVTEWKLSNGVRVLVKPTDFKADEVVFTAYSPGGNSLVSDADFMSASMAAQIVSVSGAGAFNATDLQKKLAGKAARAGATIGTTSEGMSGFASPKDLETLFQLIYLNFTAPRLDTAAFLSMKQAIDAQLANRPQIPAAAFQDSLTSILAQHHFRSRPPTPAVFGEVNPDKALAIYRDRFANAGDFSFVFVGSVQLDALKPLVEKYLGALPNTGRVETWKDVGLTTPPGIVDVTVRKGTEPVAQTAIVFTGPMQYNPQERLNQLALSTLGQMWAIDALREELGGTYSPSFGGGASARIPKPEYQFFVQYSSSPANVDKLSARFMSVVDSLHSFPASDADLTKVKEQIIRSRETQLKTNGYWSANIGNRDQAGEDIAGLLAPYDEMVKKLTAKDIQEAARRYLNKARYVKIVLLPEQKAQ